MFTMNEHAPLGVGGPRARPIAEAAYQHALALMRLDPQTGQNIAPR